MQTSVLAFCKFPTADPSNHKGWWRFICVNMFEVLSASLIMELQCLHAATLTLNNCLSFHICRLKCFQRYDFPVVFGIRVYSISHESAMLMRKSSFLSRNFLEITKYTDTLVYQYKLPAPVRGSLTWKYEGTDFRKSGLTKMAGLSSEFSQCCDKQ